MKQPVILILIFAAVFLVSSSIYTLDQTQQAIIVQLGNPVGDAVTEPGLHVKIPFIQDVVRFDRRWLEFDGDWLGSLNKASFHVVLAAILTGREIDIAKRAGLLINGFVMAKGIVLKF